MGEDRVPENPELQLLAFRHKPPPAKDRSENWLLPSVETSGRGGARADWFQTTHQDKPGRGFPSSRIKRLWPGGNPPPSARSSHTLSLSLYDFQYCPAQT